MKLTVRAPFPRLHTLLQSSGRGAILAWSQPLCASPTPALCFRSGMSQPSAVLQLWRQMWHCLQQESWWGLASCGVKSRCEWYSGRKGRARSLATPRSEDLGSHRWPWLHAEGGSEEIDGSLVALLQKDEVVRKVTQIFCLERLAAGDTITARTLLANMVAVRGPPYHPPWL